MYECMGVVARPPWTAVSKEVPGKKPGFGLSHSLPSLPTMFNVGPRIDPDPVVRSGRALPGMTVAKGNLRG
jgi:hypothetical protein